MLMLCSKQNTVYMAGNLLKLARQMAYATLQKALLLNEESLYHRDSDVYKGKFYQLFSLFTAAGVKCRVWLYQSSSTSLSTDVTKILKWCSPQPFSTALQFKHQAGPDAHESHSLCN